MGVVYEARDAVMDRAVALKAMSLPSGISPEAGRAMIERFQREARALARLSHPHIVSIYDMGEIEGQCFLVMELLRGGTLRDRIRFQGALPVAEVQRIGIAVCHALEHAHSRDIIHRDIKPDNIMLMPNGDVKLTDFGIARLADQVGLTQTGSMMGSPAYMSPEQVLGNEVSPQSDLFSLGATLYEAVFGRRAFSGEGVAVITHRVAYEEPKFPPGTPPFLEAILRRAMAKAPEDRYPSAGAMADALLREPAPAKSPAGAATAKLEDSAVCARNPEAAAIARCAECGAPVCFTCARAEEGRGVLCPDHAGRAAQPAPEAAVALPALACPSLRAKFALGLGIAGALTFELLALVPLAALILAWLELKAIAAGEAPAAGGRFAWVGLVLGAAGVLGFLGLLLAATL